jgi:hypothetical protein
MNHVFFSPVDLQALGGRIEGDPFEVRACDVVEVGCRDCPASTVCDGDFSGTLSPLVLPESGALVLRVLWRRMQFPQPSDPMYVPEFKQTKRYPEGSNWCLKYHGETTPFWVEGSVLDPCEALAAVLHDEAEKARKDPHKEDLSDSKKTHPERAGNPCPHCSTPITLQQGMFAWKGKTFSGLVCTTCNALWDNPEDSFLQTAMKNPMGAEP